MNESLENARNQNERMLKIQNRLESIQTSVDDSIAMFQAKTANMRESQIQFIQLLNGLSERTVVLHHYTEELLKNEHDLTMSKTKFEIELSQKVKQLRKEDKELTKKLDLYRKRIIEICEKKTQFSTAVTNLSNTIFTFENEEIKLNKLQNHAQRLIAQFTLTLKTDPVKTNESEIEHLQKLIIFTDKQQKEAQQQITQYNENIKSIQSICLKTKEKMEFVRKLKENTLLDINKFDNLRDLNQQKYHIMAEIDEKDQTLKEIRKKIKKIRKDIQAHKENECNSFIDSRRSMNHSYLISGMDEMVKSQYKDVKKQLAEMKSLYEAQLVEEHTLQKKVQSYNTDLSEVNESESQIENNISLTFERIEQIKDKHYHDNQVYNNLLMQSQDLEKQLKDKIIENSALQAQLKDKPSISVVYDHDANNARESYIKKVDFINYEINTIKESCANLQKHINHFTLVIEGTKAQKGKMNDDISSRKQVIQNCHDLLQSDSTNYISQRSINEAFYSYEILRSINSKSLSSTISRLQTSIAQKRNVIQHRRDDLSELRNSINSQMITFYDSIPTASDTLKRSIRFAVEENPLQDRIQTLNFLMDNLEAIQTSFDQQLDIWKKLYEKENESLLLMDWTSELNRLSEKADDLMIFNQVFGIAP